jgi:HPr kinase/phosphorylase
MMGMVHATCVRLMDIGVLLRAPSGGGKSDAAVRLIDAGGVLVADDQVELRRDGDRVVASAPESLRGLLEVRNLGILAMPSIPETEIGLVVELVPRDRLERMPGPLWVPLLEVEVPAVGLDPFESSFVAKLKVALAALARGRLGKAPNQR